MSGDWHESLQGDDDPAPGSSDRAFGLLLAGACSVLATAAAFGGRRSAVPWSLAALALLAIAVFTPPLLGPLHRGWRRFSLFLSKIFNPIIMGVLFFAVITPAAVILRWSGKDPLRLHPDVQSSSYWLERTQSTEERQISMARQF